MSNKKINDMIKKDKVCILISDGGLFGDEEAKKSIKNLLDMIPAEDLENVKIVRPQGGYSDFDGFRRLFFAQFVYDNLFETKAIYVDNLVYCSTDEVEQKIFVALMSLFGIEVYEEYETSALEPDQAYRGEIAKVFRESPDVPDCILEASREELDIVRYIAVIVLQDMWQEYRFVENKEEESE